MVESFPPLIVKAKNRKATMLSGWHSFDELQTNDALFKSFEAHILAKSGEAELRQLLFYRDAMAWKSIHFSNSRDWEVSAIAICLSYTNESQPLLPPLIERSFEVLNDAANVPMIETNDPNRPKFEKEIEQLKLLPHGKAKIQFDSFNTLLALIERRMQKIFASLYANAKEEPSSPSEGSRSPSSKRSSMRREITRADTVSSSKESKRDKEAKKSKDVSDEKDGEDKKSRKRDSFKRQISRTVVQLINVQYAFCSITFALFDHVFHR